MRRAVVLSLLVGATNVHAGNGEFHATANGSVATTDNETGAETGSPNRRASFFSDVRPGMLFTYNAPRVIQELVTEVDFLYYFGRTQPNVTFRGDWKAFLLTGPRSEMSVGATGSRGQLNALQASTPSLGDDPLLVKPEGKVNTTDPDAKRMKFGRNFLPAYNAQAVTTEDQIIVAAEITTEGVDFEQLDPMISAAERELEGAGVTERPGVVLADAGYWSNGHIDALRERGMTPIVAPDTTRNRPRKTRLGGPYDFMRRVLATESGGALYSQRQWMVEPVFAQIKANRRIERFKRRGRAAASSEWRLIAATHNLLKLYRHSLAAATA